MARAKLKFRLHRAVIVLIVSHCYRIDAGASWFSQSNYLAAAQPAV